MGNFQDLTGEKFGRLTVAKRANDRVEPSGRHRIMWLCKCDCGNYSKVPTRSLKSKHTTSCGCYNKERVLEVNVKHNMFKTRIYYIWSGMKSRCLNPNNKKYIDYGGRGIKVCDKWLEFEGFYEDMKQSYNTHVEEYGEHQTTLDRKNFNKGYYKENCRWATYSEQNSNKRNNHYVLIKNKKMTLMEASQKYQIKFDTLRGRLRKGWTIEKAISEPVRN